MKCLVDFEIQVCESLDAILDDLETTTQVFRKGDFIDFDVIDHPKHLRNGKFIDAIDYINVQFPDGSVAFGLETAWFTT